MKSFLVLLLAALMLPACGKKEEAVPAPAVVDTAATPAPTPAEEVKK